MDATPARTRSPRVARPAWMWGGIALIVSVLPALLWTITPGISAAFDVVGAAAWCVAFVLFALGRDSVVARRMPGMIVLCLLAVWPLLLRSVGPLLVSRDDPGQAAVQIGLILQLVPVVLALVAVVQVWRAAVVPRSLRWVPTIALVLCAVPAIAVNALAASPRFVAVGMDVVPTLAAVITLCRFVGLVGLGVVAIVAGMQPRLAAAVAVYPPADE